MKTRLRLAVDGGVPVRSKMLPYGRQSIDETDIQAVVEVLNSDWLTTGPTVGRFERAFADAVGAREAVAVNSGTAALHAATHAAGIGPGDEAIVPAMTFAASANCIVYQGGRPVFADVDPDTLLVDPESVAVNLSSKTKALVAVDYAGQPCDYDALRALVGDRGISLIADACHALGGSDKGRPVGTLADFSTFSLHPVKHLTSGEGGVTTTDDLELAARMRVFRNHGITSDHRQRDQVGSWAYEMVELGFNYRLTDIQCALALSQLSKLGGWVNRRRAIARRYAAAFAASSWVIPLAARPGAEHGYHLYVVQLRLEALRGDRGDVFRALRAEGIGVNVHYVPVHLHPFYRQHFGTGPGDCPIAEAAYERILSLPMFPAMTDDDVDDVVAAVHKVCTHYSR